MMRVSQYQHTDAASTRRVGFGKATGVWCVKVGSTALQLAGGVGRVTVRDVFRPHHMVRKIHSQGRVLGRPRHHANASNGRPNIY
eukprot:365303-Chlamydomonas_euryale.AAC.17